MLKRKIDTYLAAWKNDPRRKPLVVKGVRQCGKTFSVRNFAKEHYAHEVYINFYQNPEYIALFSGSLDIDHLVMMMSAMPGFNGKFVPGETVIILDEIQHCPQARTALRFFKEDGRFDVIATGSLLGIKGYREDAASIPVGSETVVEMFPLDFEEFLWANGITDTVIDYLRNCLAEEAPVSEPLHGRMYHLLLEYTVVGGMPDVVNSFVENRQINIVYQLQKDILSGYTDDMIKYADKKDKAHIRECFFSIPRQLSKENKKFLYSAVEKGARSNKFTGCLEWIEDAGIITRCHNLSLPELPLDGNAITDTFKIYMRDTGLFTSMLEEGTQLDILNGNLYGYKGAIFENLVADIFTKMGRKLYYFHKDSGLEVDFVMRYKGMCVLVEVKAASGNIKSSKTILAHPEKYHVGEAIKLGKYNIGREEKVLTLPIYMAFLLKEY